MKKVLAAMMALSVCALCGCSAKTAEVTTTDATTVTTTTAATTAAEQAAAGWDANGMTLKLEKETPAGVTIVIDRSIDTGTDELQCGSDYVLEMKKDGQWMPVPQADPEMVVAWTAEAYIIPAGGEYRAEIKWDWLYGELPVGEYRVGKSVMRWRAPGDYDTAMLYAEFAVID